MTSINVKNLVKVFPTSFIDKSLNLLRLLLGRTESRTRRSKVAVDSVSLTVNEGDILGIVGPNGAGKSTLLQMIAGILSPSSGDMDIKGHVTAVMTLGVGLKDDLTGRENIYIDAEINGKTRSEIERVVNEIIEFADLAEFIDLPIRTYSTGMKSRLAFSMIVNIDPEILIIDEALSAGDVFFARKASEKIKEICRKGKIVILVSHSIETINGFCNRCLWMQDGKIVMDGDPHLVTNAYLESVREKDEAGIRERFSGQSWSRIISGHTKIEGISFRHGSAKRLIFETGLPLSIDINILSKAKLVTDRVRLKLSRLDGFVFFDMNLSDMAYQIDLNKEKLKITIDIESFFAGPGVYFLEARILDETDEPVAMASDVFEIKAQTLLTGGRSALYYPVELTSAQV